MLALIEGLYVTELNLQFSIATEANFVSQKTAAASVDDLFV